MWDPKRLYENDPQPTPKNAPRGQDTPRDAFDIAYQGDWCWICDTAIRMGDQVVYRWGISMKDSLKYGIPCKEPRTPLVYHRACYQKHGSALFAGRVPK